LTLNQLHTRLGRKALLGEFLLQTSGVNQSGEDQRLGVVTAHLESYPEDVYYRNTQMNQIFTLLEQFPHSIFTADFNFAEPEEDGVFPDTFTDTWKVRFSRGF
jgi:hypothetical protein